MDEQDIAKMAFYGTPLGTALPHEWLLWYRLRAIYSDVKAGRRNKADGKKCKTEAVNAYRSQKEAHERSTLLWKRIEKAGAQYSKNRTLENADAFYKAVYGINAGGGRHEQKT